MYLTILIIVIIIITCCILYYSFLQQPPFSPPSHEQQAPLPPLSPLPPLPPPLPPLPHEQYMSTSFTYAPEILDKLDLTTEDRTEFINEYIKIQQVIPKLESGGDSSILLKQKLRHNYQNIDKQAVYTQSLKLIGNKKIDIDIDFDLTNSIIILAIFIVMHRKYVPIPTEKNLLDIRLDINHTIQKEFRCIKLFSKEASQIRLGVSNFLSRIDCILDENVYNTVITCLVRGYGIVTKLHTLDAAINDFLTDINKGIKVDSNEFIQYGLVKYNCDLQKWIPTLKAKLYSFYLENLGILSPHDIHAIEDKLQQLDENSIGIEAKFTEYIQYNSDTHSWETTNKYKYLINTDFIESNNRIQQAITRLKTIEPGDEQDLVDEGYIVYDGNVKKWILTDKIYTINYESCIVKLEKCNIDDDVLYKDVVYFLQQFGYKYFKPDNIYLDLSTFIKTLHGKIEQDDYRTMIANVSKAYICINDTILV